MSKYLQSIEIPRPEFLGPEPWRLDRLNDITILFGKNGSGKSLLLRNWRNADFENCHYIIPERIGTLSFEARYLDMQVSSEARRDHSASNFSNSYREQVISRRQTYFMTRGASRVDKLPGNPNDLEDLLKFLLPDFYITIKAGKPPYQIRRLLNDQEINNIEQLSSGESQLVTVALDILTIAAIWDIDNKDRRILLIDEPDAHLHPDLQVRFADFISRVIEKFNVQIVISTHSTTLLSALGQFNKKNCSIIYMTKDLAEYEGQVFTDNLKEISACLGGHVLMGPLFGAPILIVEGDDDYRIWSQVPRHGKVNVAVIPGNGDEIKNYQKLFEKIFASISEPRIMGNALLDGDKRKPESNERNPQNYIPFIQLSCYESENLFITDEVLQDLQKTWDQARECLVHEAANFGNKRAEIEALAGADRRTVDLKNIINEVSKNLDSKNVHWTTRIGNRIGRAKPEGQLAEFLGEEVLNSLWNE